jgi:uncharacterized membrane protein
MTVNLNFPPEIKVVVEHVGKQEIKEINMKLDELIAQIGVLSSQLSRIRAEILAKIAALESLMGDLTPEQQAVFDQLKQEVSALDNIAPEVVEPPVQEAVAKSHKK